MVGLASHFLKQRSFGCNLLCKPLDDSQKQNPHRMVRMTVLNIQHRTTYRYRTAISLGPHRLLLRPRESRDVRVVSYDLAITPQATVAWAYDVFGNAVASAGFQGQTDKLEIISSARLELGAVPWPIFDIATSAINYPFRYSDEEWTDLGALANNQYSDQSSLLRTWAQGFVASGNVDTLSLLKDLSAGVSRWVTYESREEEGTQSPIQTLERRSGSCRDFALLFAEAARCLGFGARLVSGYLQPAQNVLGSQGAGSTHAWAEIYIPGAGWITFDPTNGTMGGFGLIPVAVVRDIRFAIPVAGGFVGPRDAVIDMAVVVSLGPDRI
jgi:transglutaminase-like putative cysteine protease